MILKSEESIPCLRLYLAPIRGITDVIFRSLFVKYFPGFDVAISPFVSTSSGCNISQSALKDLMPERNRALPVIPQILTNRSDEFLSIASQLIDIGYSQINWNLGCPSPTVTPKKKGAGLLPYPDRIESVLDSVFSEISCKISIKTRLGMENPEEIFKLLPIFNKYPLDSLIIHSRTGKQFYTGSVNLDFFERCLAISANPVVYNGDIFDLETFKQLSTRFKDVNQWMVGRGALMNPFLICKLKGNYIAENRAKEVQIFRLFHDELFESYSSIFSGPAHLLGKMKAIWLYFSHFFPQNTKLLKKLKKTKTIFDYESLISQLISDVTQKSK